ncbi:helicase-related protein [Hydrogenophaga sp. 2FB]|uniref:helicase-related protein n=1 Tax=Hydrogenophaga sp. 2FB TaxID=2502187 RepID=UPI00207B9B36|nr:helicase-related protein [Hydrogenophaga sp. 2FB]
MRGDELGRLKRLGFSTLAECLLSAPKEYRDFTSSVLEINDSHVGATAYFELKSQSMALFDNDSKPVKSWQNCFRLEITCTDLAGVEVRVVVFGNVWPYREMELGETLHLFGTLDYFRDRLCLQRVSPVPREQRGTIATIYRGKAGQVSAESLAAGVARALHRLDEAAVLMLAQAGLRDSEFRETYKVLDPKGLLYALHRPKSLTQGKRARQIARQMSLDTVVRRAVAAKSRPAVAGSAVTIDKKFLAGLVADLPYPLTDDQRQAVNEIVDDLRSAFPMRRLLSGDVGTGKSITFMLPAAAAYEAGAEVAILAPSQLVAEQIASEFGELFPGLPVCLVLAGGKIGEGICVGTTALLSAAKRAKKVFDIAIVDEQHKFSVDQKLALVGKKTNLLEATATAIPRTLALVNFGGMDVSLLRQSPVKKKIETVLVDDEAMGDVHDFIKNDIVSGGGQLAVIYPLVSDDGGDGEGGSRTVKKSNEGLESVIGAAQQWERRYPGRVGVLHGRMTSDEKTEVIKAMHAKKLSVLVSSSVIEVGVTLPSLQALLIESPDRYGLSQLHQLRGRLARKGGEGTFFLRVNKNTPADAMERLRVLEQVDDGFTLAERDMSLRGFGDVEDDSQSQTGSARTLFHGVGLTHKEIRDTAKSMGLVV